MLMDSSKHRQRCCICRRRRHHHRRRQQQQRLEMAGAPILLAVCLVLYNVRCTVALQLLPIEIPMSISVPTFSTNNNNNNFYHNTEPPSPHIQGDLLLSSLLLGQQQQQQETTTTKRTTTTTSLLLPSQRDQVVKILDANTIKLQKNGIVSIAGMKMPTPGKSGNFQFPSCFDRSPTYKIRQLLPTNTEVLVKVVTKGNNSQQQSAVIIRREDLLFVNIELVRAGFGKVQKVTDPILQEYLNIDELRTIQSEAESKGLGIFQRCSSSSSSDGDNNYGDNKNNNIVSAPFEAQFEPLEYTIETQWRDDGGRQVIKTTKKDGNNEIPPKNPGDIKGCSDFNTYEDALRWYEYYKLFYGDVAKLDRDNDGIPCPGLPHTKNQDQYRMKVPSSS